MKLDNMLPYRALALSVALFGVLSNADPSQSLCASSNTGDESTYSYSIYQSLGLCTDTCNRGGYAFAVVQYQSCWCSNVAPAGQTDPGSCNSDCPGYPQEQCGNQGSGLFGYVALGPAPSDTAGASSASSASSTASSQQSSRTAPSSTTAPRTSTVSISITVTPSQEVSVSYVTRTPTTTSSSTRITSTTTSTTTSSTSTETPVAVVPVTSVIRTVISGAVVTQTVTSTPVAAGGANQQPDSLHLHRDNGLGGGAIAGIVIGLLAFLALLGVGAFLLWRRKRNQEGEESGTGCENLGRNVSVLSKAGLLARSGTVRPSMGERDHDDTFTGQNSVRHSMMFAPGAAEGVSPVSPLGSSDGSSHSRRMSKPMVYDQRLNPSALFANQEANGSRVSMQDAQDYTRPLGVMNPDVRASFESRVSRA